MVLKARMGGVDVKGKGHMRTFWVSGAAAAAGGAGGDADGDGGDGE